MEEWKGKHACSVFEKFYSRTKSSSFPAVVEGSFASLGTENLQVSCFRKRTGLPCECRQAVGCLEAFLNMFKGVCFGVS